MKQVSAAPSTVVSNVTGMNCGQLFHGRAPAVDTFEGQLCSGREVNCYTGNHQSRSCVCRHQIPRRRSSLIARSAEHCANQGCVVRRRTPAKFFQRGALKSKILRLDCKAAEIFRRPGRSDMSFTGNGDFIQSIRAMNNPGGTRTESSQRTGDRLKQRSMPNTHKLKWSARWIGQRAEKIKGRMHT